MTRKLVVTCMSICLMWANWTQIISDPKDQGMHFYVGINSSYYTNIESYVVILWLQIRGQLQICINNLKFIKLHSVQLDIHYEVLILFIELPNWKWTISDDFEKITGQPLTLNLHMLIFVFGWYAGCACEWCTTTSCPKKDLLSVYSWDCHNPW